MELNTLLLWFAGIGTFTMAARVLAAPAAHGRSWLVVCIAIGFVGGAAYLHRPEHAGFVLAALWITFLLAPLWAQQLAMRAVGLRNFERARVFARAAVMLHPFGALYELPESVRVLERLSRGEQLPLAEPAPGARAAPLERYVYAQTLRAQGRFAELAAFTRGLPAPLLQREAALALLKVRALAELGELDAMLEACAQFEHHPTLAGARDSWRLIASARLGRIDLTRTLLSGPLARAQSEENARFWLATAHQTAGQPEVARDLLQSVIAAAPDDLQRAARQRAAEPLAPVEVAQLTPAAQRTLAELAIEIEASAGITTRLRSKATSWLIASLAVAFALELPGGSTTTANLLQLGALTIPPTPPWDGLWRVATAAWLHLGPIHFAMNAAGLFILGRRVEAVTGGLRMFAVYTTSALAGNLVARTILNGPAILVGASGGVMGLLGALLAIGLRRQRNTRSRFMRQHLIGILLAIGLQALFDLTTPQVSSTAHIAGFITGYFCTLTLRVR